MDARARGEHGDDLGVVGQLGGEEDHRDEYEQRAEEVGEVGDEVEVVVKDDRLPRGIVGHELVDVLVVVEHHGDGDDQRYGKEIMAQELRDDVPVQTTE